MKLKGKHLGTCATNDGKPTGFDELFELPEVKKEDLKEGMEVLIKVNINVLHEGCVYTQKVLEIKDVVAILPPEPERKEEVKEMKWKPLSKEQMDVLASVQQSASYED